MSAIAGNIASTMGNYYLAHFNRGKGMLLARASGSVSKTFCPVLSAIIFTGLSKEIAVMTENQRPVVGKIIDAFKSRLDESVREQISSAQYDDLAIMINGAITEELGAAAALVEDVARKLRESAPGPELEL